jgi:hypothetical protein
LFCRVAATFRNVFKTLVLVETATLKALRLFYFMTTEIWKDVIGYEGLYQVSNLGNVKSLIFKKEKILKPQLSTNKYLMLNLYKDKKLHRVLIHRIMYESFYGIRSCKQYVIDHIDNNKQNNNLNNLQYISNRKNSSKDKTSKSGHSNIYLNSGSYLVRMRVNNIKKSIGTFKNIEDAIIVRDLYIKELENK